MSSIKSFIKNTFIYGIAAVLPKAVNVFLVGLQTKTLPDTSAFNTNTEFYVWAAYFNVLLTFGMETAFFKFYNSEDNKLKVNSTSFYSVGIVTITLLGSLLIFPDSISNSLGFKEVLHFKTLVWIALFDTLVVIPFAYLRVNNHPIQYAFFKVTNILIFALFNVVFLVDKFNLAWIQNLYPTASKTGYIFFANFIASAITFILILPKIKLFKFQFDWFLCKKMLSYGWPILIAGIAYITNENLDKLLLPRLLDPYIAGAYAGSYKLGVFMSLFIMAFKLGAEPFFFNIAKDHNAQEKYAMVMKWFTYLGTVIIIVIVGYIDFFANLLLKKPEYLETLNIVPIILIANLLLGIYNNLSVWYKITGKTRFAMYFSITGGILTIIGLIVLIPKLGYVGAAWVTLVAYGFMMLISYFYGQKHYPVAYDISRILGILILCAILSYITFAYFREQFLLNTFIIIGLMGTILTIEYKFIKQLFSKS